ncbi:MAG: hypothetical protein ACRDG4_10135 [Chloroflexota bacterium]
MPNQLSILIANLPDREVVVAELWNGDARLAELSHEGGSLTLEIFASPNGKPWTLPFEDTLESLKQARAKLLVQPEPDQER